MNESTVAIRRRKLREWIDTHHAGVQASFVAKTEINQGELSGLLKNKSFGEKRARAIEKLAGMPPGYLDGEGGWEPWRRVEQEYAPYETEDKYVYIPVYSGVYASMGNGGRVEHEEVSGKHSYSQAWLLKEGLEAAQLSRIQAVGRSMEPVIWDGDMLLVNRSEKIIKDGKIYAFRVGDEIRVKRLFRLMDGRVRVVSDNPDKNLYPDEHLSIDDMPEVIGRVRDRSGNTNL